jgi:hypothetical protein
MNLSVIHPVYFFDNKVMRNENIGTPEVKCVIHQLQHMNTSEDNSYNNMEIILKDFVANNISELSNTFMIKLLEDFIDKNEIAYIVDFNNDFDMKNYLINNLSTFDIYKLDNDSISNIIRSNIIFILNQFIQFYCMYKLIYNEGVNLYEFLYKETYGADAPNNKNQNKYVFCISILSNMLETLLADIDDCCYELKSTISNIKSLY